MPDPRIALFCGALALATGCAPGSGTYCQSGAKYGTQCYGAADVQRAPGVYEAPDQTDGAETPAKPPPSGKVKWK